MKTHPFQPDHELGADVMGRREICCCGLPRENAAHELPGRDEDERKVEARKVGEAVDT